MQKTPYVAFAAAILLCSTGSALAESLNSGNRVLRGCRGVLQEKPVQDTADAMTIGLCAGEIAALFAASDFLKKEFSFCKPSDATVYQGIQVVVQATDSAPESNHKDFVVLAIDALARAWPCRK